VKAENEMESIICYFRVEISQIAYQCTQLLTSAIKP